MANAKQVSLTFYKWLVVVRSENIPIDGKMLQEKALDYAYAQMEVYLCKLKVEAHAQKEIKKRITQKAINHYFNKL